MKNNLIFFLIVYFFINPVFSEPLIIQSKNISLDKEKEITVFQNEVYIKTDQNHTIESDYAKYDKKNGIIKFKKDIKLTDNKNNIVEALEADYIEKDRVFRTYGFTKIITTENYIIEGNDIILNKNENSIKSEKETIIIDNEKNKIKLNNFEYNRKNKIFKSIGNISINDKFENSYEFSQLYIDSEKKEIIGSDVSAFINDEKFKFDEKNNPRIMANTIKSNNRESVFGKSIFTLCGYRTSKEKDKCPPWTIQATKMKHDNLKKTIYYDNALIKVYNIPIFYLPKLSHPDPSVKRRSGFLPPTLTDTKNLGSGLSVPYYLALNEDKDFTFTNKLYVNENPLFMGEYRQAFKNSNLMMNMGYTEGYKNTTKKKTSGDKSHLFTKFVKNFKQDDTETNLNIQTQSVSNDKYLKLYKIQSNLIDYNNDYLENSFNFSHTSDDFFKYRCLCI